MVAAGERGGRLSRTIFGTQSRAHGVHGTQSPTRHIINSNSIVSPYLIFAHRKRARAQFIVGAYREYIYIYTN